MAKAFLLLGALCLGSISSAHSDTPDDKAFTTANQTAMDRMMTDMSVPPSGDVDKDFVAMMIPHHQGAIDMARAELRYGRSEILRRIAQEIIVDQQQEITAMHLALGQDLLPGSLTSRP